MKKLILFLSLAFPLVLGAQSEKPKPETTQSGNDTVLRVFVPQVENRTPDKSGSQFQTPLISATVQRFKKRGFVVLSPFDKEGSKTAQYLVDSFFVIEENRLVFQMSITHQTTGRVIASDMVSTFAGLTSFDVINEMLDTLIKKTQAFAKTLEKNKGKAIPLPDALVFKGSQEGVSVSWGDGESFGQIEKGQLEAPFYPFPSDGTIVVRLSKQGFIPRTEVFKLTADTKELSLPPLTPEYSQEIYLSTGLGRLAGIGGAYRYFPIKNQVFLAAEDYMYFQIPTTKGGKAVFHNDLWFSAGVYLFFPPESDFRFAYQAGFGFLITPLGDQIFLDPAILPFSLILEYKGFGIPLFYEMRFPYDLGGTNSLLGQRWLMVGDGFPMISVGVSWRW